MTTNNQNDKKTSLPNGARAKIMRALFRDGMLTSNEISEKTGLTSKQVRDNCSQARTIGLVTLCMDDVTRTPAHRITDEGRNWVEMQNIRYSSEKSYVEKMEAEDETEQRDDDTSGNDVDVDVDVDADEPRSLSDDAVDDGVLYAIETSTWNMKITGNDQDAAIAMAIDQAKTTNISHRVFRMEPIGAAMPVTTVQFVTS